MAKIGEGHAGAMFRLGLRELRSASYPDSNVAQSSEYGLYGTLTPGEVAEARRGDGREVGEEAENGSVLDDRLRQAKEREEPGRDDKGLERE